MRVVVQRTEDGGLTVRVGRPGSALSPGQIAAAVAAAVDRALAEPAAGASRCSRRSRARLIVPPAPAGSPAAATSAGSCPAAVEAPGARIAVRVVAVGLTAASVTDLVEVVTVTDFTDDGGAPAAAQVEPCAGARQGEEALWREALRLLDEGLADEQVCRRLSICRGRLLRFDDPFSDPGLDEQIEAAEWVADDQPVPLVAQLRAPCWVAVCTGCGADMENSEYGPNLRYPTGAAVDADADAADLSCVDGCRPPDHDRRPDTHLEDPASSMDPLPGLETWGAKTRGAKARGPAAPASPVVVA